MDKAETVRSGMKRVDDVLHELRYIEDAILRVVEQLRAMEKSERDAVFDQLDEAVTQGAKRANKTRRERHSWRVGIVMDLRGYLSSWE